MRSRDPTKSKFDMLKFENGSLQTYQKTVKSWKEDKERSKRDLKQKCLGSRFDPAVQTSLDPWVE